MILVRPDPCPFSGSIDPALMAARGAECQGFRPSDRAGKARFSKPVGIPFRDWSHSSIFSAEMNASCGMSTRPNWRIFFLPFFCFSRSFFLRVASPP